MAAEMADLRHAAAEVEVERDEAGEEVGRLGAELDRLQQEWASDSAEFKVLLVLSSVLAGTLFACAQKSGGHPERSCLLRDGLKRERTVYTGVKAAV